MRKASALALVIALLSGALGAAHAAAAKSVWKDVAGDVDVGGSGPTPVGDASGFDLIGGSIQRKGANLIFTVKHASMPEFGEIPETFRFLWAFSVGKTVYRVTAKRTEIGKPNPATQEDADQVGKVYPDGFFRLEGNCGETPLPALLTLVNCHTIAYLTGTWDPAKATFTFAVPLKSIRAKTGSKVGPGDGGICPICWVSHVVERSHQNTVVDGAAQSGVYKVPR